MCHQVPVSPARLADTPSTLMNSFVHWSPLAKTLAPWKSCWTALPRPKTITPVAAIYKESGDFDRVLHILKQETDSVFDPWYIGYGMDDEKGHNRNLSTIYTV